jgi:hypothetical protein
VTWAGGPSAIPRVAVTSYGANCATAGTGSAIYGLPSGMTVLSVAMQTTGALAANSVLLTIPGTAPIAAFEFTLCSISGSPVIPVYTSGSNLLTRIAVASGVTATGTLTFVASR